MASHSSSIDTGFSKQLSPFVKRGRFVNNMASNEEQLARANAPLADTGAPTIFDKVRRMIHGSHNGSQRILVPNIVVVT